METTLTNPGSQTPEFTLDGALDTLEAEKFQTTVLSSLQQSGNHGVILDCTLMPYLTSTGLRSFMTIGKAARANGGDMVLVGLSGLAREIFTASGFSKIFPMADCVEDARQRLQSGA